LRGLFITVLRYRCRTLFYTNLNCENSVELAKKFKRKFSHITFNKENWTPSWTRFRCAIEK